MDDNQKQNIKQIIRRMPSYIKLIYRLYGDSNVPGSAKLKLSLALGYNISPIDLIPDFIPIVGQIDNVYFTLKLLKKALEACHPDIAEKHLKDCGMNMDSIDMDISTSGQLMKDIGSMVISTTGKVISKSSSKIYKAGKSLLKPKRKDKE